MSDNPSAPDLSFVATADMLLELSRRYRAAMILWCEEAKGQQNAEDYGVIYAGGRCACIGMAARAAHDLTHSKDSEWADPKPSTSDDE